MVIFTKNGQLLRILPDDRVEFSDKSKIENTEKWGIFCTNYYMENCVIKSASGPNKFLYGLEDMKVRAGSFRPESTFRIKNDSF